jgi:D-alanyl-D-alanine carboxypeptidase (penicillin-binding protein 5/6)
MHFILENTNNLGNTYYLNWRIEKFLMNRRRTLAFTLLAIALILFISVPVWLFTPLGANVAGLDQPDLNGPPLTPLVFQRVPRAIPQAVLTPKGEPGQFTAREALLMDADTGNILFEKNGEAPMPMASTTKIMTALIAIQSGKLNQIITVGQDAVDQDKIGSSAGLYLGDKISLKDLLYGLMLPSGDDAAVAIADGIAGSQDAFTIIMNVEAKKLHLFQTHFFDPTGLDTYLDLSSIPANTHYTTPYDLVHLAHYAMRIPLFAQIVSTKSYMPPAGTSHSAILPWHNTNTLLTSYKGTLGIKTGWTGAAEGCLVFAAKRNGHTLIGVVLHSTKPGTPKTQQVLDEQARAADAQTLLDWGFGLPMQVPQM